MSYQRPTLGVCDHCKRRFAIGPIGRVPRFCRPACRTAACTKRGPKLSLEDKVAARAWEMLVAAKLVEGEAPRRSGDAS